MAKVNFEILDDIRSYGEGVGFSWDFESYGGEDPEEDEIIPLSIVYAFTIEYLFRKGIIDDHIEEAMDYIQNSKDEEDQEEEPKIDITRTANIIKMLKKNTGIDEND